MKKKFKKMTDLVMRDTPIHRFFHIVAGAGLLIIGGVVLWVALSPIPSLDSLNTRKVAQSTKIYDRTEETILFDLNSDVRRNLIPLEDISPYAIKAAIAIEDSEFYTHSGVRLFSFLRAVAVNIMQGGYVQGGSTITQQAVKLTLLTGEKSIVRKLHEWILAFKLEEAYTKDEILELYLNNTPYGGTLYGIEAASRAFFGKSASTLTLGESAYLAALPQSPTFLSPYGNNRDRLETRKNLVLERMRLLSYITQEEYDAAKKETVVFSPVQNSSIIAPHFVFYVREYLEEKYGPDVVEEGLIVTTSLDVDLQNHAEEIVYRYAIENETKFNASNASLIALDPKTGEILSMVGSRNYFDKAIDGNFNATLAYRQPGSSFKPFVYAAALEKGYSPFTPVDDYPTQFSVACSAEDVFNSTYPCYAPQNYDGQFRGPMTFMTALAQSRNIPAIKALYLAGIPETLDLAKRLGITSLGTANEYGLSLALGAGEVPLLDMTAAFSAFANDGELMKPVAVLKVTDMRGEVLEEYKPKGTQAVSEAVARDINYMLSNNEARFPEYPPNNPFFFPGYDVAAKTGTTNDYRDVWTIGYTPTIAVGVWAGNNDNTPMEKRTAGFIISPLWNEFMDYALTVRDKEYFGARISGDEFFISSYDVGSSTERIEQTPMQRSQERRWSAGARLYEREKVPTSTEPTHILPTEVFQASTTPPIEYEVDEGVPL